MPSNYFFNFMERNSLLTESLFLRMYNLEEYHFMGIDPCIGCLHFGSQIRIEGLFDIRPNSLNPDKNKSLNLKFYNSVNCNLKERCLKTLKDLLKKKQNEKREILKRVIKKKKAKN